MASVFSHAIASVALGKVSFVKEINWKFWLAGIFCAVVPDADAIGFFMGIPYDSLMGHRGITHSIFFAIILSLFISIICFQHEQLFSKKWWAIFLFLFLSTISHGIIDTMTTGGLGVAFFAPFNNERYFFPWKVIQVSPIGISKFFSEWGWRVIKSEIKWIWIPSFIIIILWEIIKNTFSKKSKFEN